MTTITQLCILRLLFCIIICIACYMKQYGARLLYYLVFYILQYY